MAAALEKARIVREAADEETKKNAQALVDEALARDAEKKRIMAENIRKTRDEQKVRVAAKKEFAKLAKVEATKEINKSIWTLQGIVDLT